MSCTFLGRLSKSDRRERPFRAFEPDTAEVCGRGVIEILMLKESIKWNYRMLECLVFTGDGKREIEILQQKQERIYVAAQAYLT